MPILSSVMWNGIATTGIYNGVQVWGGSAPTVYNITLQTDGHGTISADALSGYTDDVITLSQTANSNYTFSNYTITGATLTGSQFRIENSDVTAQANYTQNVYTLTLQNDGHGTIAASKTTGHAGDTVTLSNTYNTYYRFNNYTQTGGSLNGSTFTFGSQNATAKANFKVNAFTATGNFEKGSNQSLNAPNTKGGTNNANVAEKYAIHVAHTGDIPASWYATSNRWNPSNASAYSAKINSKMTFTSQLAVSNSQRGQAYITAATIINSTLNSTAKYVHSGSNGPFRDNYNKTVNITTQGTFGVSAKLSCYAGSPGSYNYGPGKATATYVATGTTGTWTATGYAP